MANSSSVRTRALDLFADPIHTSTRLVFICSTSIMPPRCLVREDHESKPVFGFIGSDQRASVLLLGELLLRAFDPRGIRTPCAMGKTGFGRMGGEVKRLELWLLCMVLSSQGGRNGMTPRKNTSLRPSTVWFPLRDSSSGSFPTSRRSFPTEHQLQSFTAAFLPLFDGFPTNSRCCLPIFY